MKLWINGTEREASCTTLAELIARLAYEPTSVATAVDGEFIPRAQREAISLADGMCIDIVAPIQGG